MTDIKSPSAPARPTNSAVAAQDVSASNPGAEQTDPCHHGSKAPDGVPDESIGGSQHELVTFAELLFFAYRDFTADADAILLEYGFGRAHHRVLHFVARTPGLRIADLLQILKITKQSLARVLRHLLDEDILLQKPGSNDRRERRLYATAKGAALAARLSALQSKRIETALQRAGPGADETVKRFLFAMIKRADRQAVDACLERPGQVNSDTAAQSSGSDTFSGDKAGPVTTAASKTPCEEE